MTTHLETHGTATGEGPATLAGSAGGSAATGDSGLPAGTVLWKAHGTGNSFLLLDDPEGQMDVDPATVAALCDVSRGIGADGLIRCVRADGRWFMDYRNADGSLAEMCGNGVRVFVDHLQGVGLVDLGEDEVLEVGTRGGVKRVRALGPRPMQVPGPVWQRGAQRPLVEESAVRESGAVSDSPEGAGGWAGTGAGVGAAPADTDATEQWYSIDMGPAVSTGVPDMTVTVVGLEETFEGIRVAMPNPHVVVDVSSREALRDAVLPTTDIHLAPVGLRPAYHPDPASGINLELVVDVSEPGAEIGHLLMRVLERGVGETQSCGTGCCAAAVASAARRGAGAPRTWIVEVPGGSVRVDLGEGSSLSGVTLSGPATPIAEARPFP
ncbi:MAG: diaminopimelate epimerase [Pauljensenia sp.]